MRCLHAPGLVEIVWSLTKSLGFANNKYTNEVTLDSSVVEDSRLSSNGA
jgi:hypothetical protein